MGQYYKKSLSAERLKRCYDIAPKRTIQYLEAEITYVQKQIEGNHIVMELGCGYGRVLERLVNLCDLLIGIDLAQDNLVMARSMLSNYDNLELLLMNAEFLSFQSELFDVVVCIQNGLSAFRIEPLKLVSEALRVTRKGGFCLFSSYSEKFWNDRLEWFMKQSEAGLLGEIDYEATNEGLIVCKDGFQSSTLSERDFESWSELLHVEYEVFEVDSSSLFWKVKK